MLSIPGNARLFVYAHPVNIRRSFEGLGSLIEKLYPDALLSGSFFIFLNKRRDHIKILFWDRDGFIIWFKRLEKGTFPWKWGNHEELNRTTLLLLLEGVIPKRIQRRFSL